jgi:hypothetical protein
MAAYQATARIVGATGEKSKEWWVKAKDVERRKELERIKGKAVDVLDFAHQATGAGR